jgi:2-dehydropantoate 2-reductase
MKIAVMGTGGVGGYYGGLLAGQGHEVTFIARGAHLQAIQAHGLQVKSIFGDFRINPARATDDPNQIGTVDLVLFVTKSYHTDQAAQAIRSLVGPETSVLSLQNGVDAVDRIGSVIGREHMLAGATWLSSAVEAPGVIKQISQFRRVVLGELDGKVSTRAQAVHKAFEATGITAEFSENILKVLWTKFVFIAAVSSVGSLTRLPMGSYREVSETRAILASLMKEVKDVAQAEGVILDEDVVQKSLDFIDKSAPHIKPSMQLDVESGRRTELESMVGVIGRKGQVNGVLTPVADFVYASLLPVELKAQTG